MVWTLGSSPGLLAQREYTLEICSEKHEEIVYDGSECPCCKMVDLLEEAEKEVDGVKEEVEKLMETLGNISWT